MSYIFGGNTGMTYEQAQRARAMAEAIAKNRITAPKNVGEGLSAIGQALAFRGLTKRADKADAKGRTAAQEAFASVMGGGVPMPSAGGRGGAPAGSGAPSGFGGQGAGRGMASFRDAIAAVESRGSGDYAAIGPVVEKGSYAGDRAFGRYQVMGKNVPEWTRTALGQEMTPQQFLNSPEAQDAVFDHYFGKSLQKYGNPQDAASVWFSGSPVQKAGNRSDGYTTVPEYIQKFNRALGSGGAPQGAPAPVGGSQQRLQQLIEAANNPYMSDGQRAAIESEIQRLQRQSDPMYQMGLERSQLELERLRNPPAPDRDTAKDRNGVLRYTDTGEAVFPDVQTEQPVASPEDSSGLRKEFNSLPLVKDFADRAAAFSQISEAAKLETGAGDIAVVTSYMKMLDPGSTVREGEYATAENAAGVPERVRNLWNSVVDGDGLSPRARGELVMGAKQLYTESQRQYADLADQYTRHAEAAGIDPERAITGYGYQQSGAPIISQVPQRAPGRSPIQAMPAAPPPQSAAPPPQVGPQPLSREEMEQAIDVLSRSPNWDQQAFIDMPIERRQELMRNALEQAR